MENREKETYIFSYYGLLPVKRIDYLNEKLVDDMLMKHGKKAMEHLDGDDKEESVCRTSIKEFRKI